MKLLKFLVNRMFFIQIVISFVLIFILSFILTKILGVYTNHGQEIEVPNVKKLAISQAADLLEQYNLKYVIIDSVEYRSNIPKGAIVEQEPFSGSKVKEDRKIYLKINASGYAEVVLPNLVQKTYRQVLPTLRGLGLDEGKIIYVPNIAKDMVLELRYKDRILKPGDKVLKTSKIDLVLGDGKAIFSSDSIRYEQQY